MHILVMNCGSSSVKFAVVDSEDGQRHLDGHLECPAGELETTLDEAMHQVNTSGTGIGTFNDRMRDSLRGGNFDHAPRSDQGFINGLSLNPNHSPWNTDTPKGAAADAELTLGGANIRLRSYNAASENLHCLIDAVELYRITSE